MKTHLITERLAGTSARYWILKTYLDGKLVNVHTSKDYSYICRLSHGW